MKTSDFYFDLPEELIAQVPILDRSSSKLMVLDKETGDIEHKTFKNVIDYLNPGDCLVLNNTRVIPARLIGEKVDTGGKIEFLLLKRTEEDTWQALVKPGKRAKIGTKFSFGNGKLIGEDRNTIEDVYEPYLLQLGFINRGPRGRIAMPLAYEHLNMPYPTK